MDPNQIKALITVSPYIVFGCYILFKILLNRNNQMLLLALKKSPPLELKSFFELQPILEWHMERAYKITYKDEILVYSIDGMTIKEDDYTNVQKKFIILTRELMGEFMFMQLTQLYGDERALYRNMCIYFDDAYENDKIRVGATEEMTRSTNQTTS